jgi:nitrate/TMAO reductase-like tetraheme cytochrome c subunit
LQPGWPTNWKDFNAFIPYDEMHNMCMDCTSLTNPGCLRNMQSPIHLERNATARFECRDRHRMNFVTGSCKLGQLDFQILPHGKNQLIF